MSFFNATKAVQPRIITPLIFDEFVVVALIAGIRGGSGGRGLGLELSRRRATGGEARAASSGIVTRRWRRCPMAASVSSPRQEGNRDTSRVRRGWSSGGSGTRWRCLLSRLAAGVSGTPAAATRAVAEIAAVTLSALSILLCPR